MEMKSTFARMRILIKMIHALGVERGRTALETVDLVTLLKEEFGEVRTVLAGDTCDQGFLACGHQTFHGLARNLKRDACPGVR
jgi:hypothetical protein